jgi:ribose/xylose/arabinose/galactoside ABC-type transport system permease subunit
MKSAAQVLPAGEQPSGGGWRQLFGSGLAIRRFGALIALLLLILFNLAFTPNFATTQTLSVNLTQVCPIVIVGVGMTLVIATGGIDLSVGSLMAIAGALSPQIFQGTLFPVPDLYTGIALGIVIPVLVAGLFGLFNGWLISSFNIQPIIATLILFIAGRGIAQVWTNGDLQVFKVPEMQAIAIGRVLGVPFQVWIMVAVVAIAAWVLRKTVFGRQILAVGGNAHAAELSGISIFQTTVWAHGLSGLLAALAGVMVVARLQIGQPSIGDDWLILSFAAPVIGGAVLAGGHVSVAGTTLGVVVVAIITQSLVLFHIDPFVVQIVLGALILWAVGINRWREVRVERRLRRAG